MLASPRSILLAPCVAVLLTGAARTLPHAPAPTIEGRVVDATTNAPLRGAQVSIDGTSIGTLTGADGRYLLVVPESGLPADDVHLRAMLIGYAQADTVIEAAEMAAGSTLTVDLHLKPNRVELTGLVVTGAGTRVPHATPPPATHRVAPKTPGQRGWPRGDREQYAHVAENRFQAVEHAPRSTISIDVDRASYSNVRRFLQDGRLPPVDAVQIEEMVNYFAYHYELPRGDAPVAVTTELGAVPWNPRHRLLRVGLASRPVPSEEMPPANLVFLLDVSGSMGAPDKLPLVKASMRMLLDRLRSRDRVAIVVYAGAAGVVLEPTPGNRKRTILEALERLQAGGSTAGGAGLRLAYDVAEACFRRDGNNRVILATDGDFNVGESSDAALVRLIEEKRAGGTFLTVLGFGTGNLQSEKMQTLAQHGNGNYAYVDGLREAHKVLVREMGGTLLTVARDVKVQIEFNPARVSSYRLLGYENRLLATEDFNDDGRDAGDLGAGHTVTALYELVPAGGGERTPGDVDPLRYGTEQPRRGAERGDELAFVKVRYKRPEGGASRLLEHPVRAEVAHSSTDLSFAAAVAGFGMMLRGSKYADALTPRGVLALAEDALGADPDGDRHEFLDLVRAYGRLTSIVAGRR